MHDTTTTADDDMRRVRPFEDGPLRDRLRAAAAALAAARGRPCLLMVAPTIGRRTVLAVREALAGLPHAPLDIVIASDGGDVHGAYLAAREIRRHAPEVAMFVPLLAKSAATVFYLAGDELVLGPLGELGPLDAQAQERRKAQCRSH